METKQVIVIRKDLNMRRGKEIAQGSHASMAFLTKVLSQRIENFRKHQLNHPNVSVSDLSMGVNLTEAQAEWIENSFRKITCSVDSLDELLELDRLAKEAGVESNVITDSGLTEFNGVPTITCLAIGPDYDSKIDPITSKLKLY
jgi:PTH2 family peptidyl-tRNA hydrolase